MSQQALSGQIRQLEERIGAKLLDRDTRRVDPTLADSALLESARPLIAGAEQAVAAAQEAGEGTRTLTVGFLVPVGYALMRGAFDSADLELLSLWSTPLGAELWRASARSTA